MRFYEQFYGFHALRTVGNIPAAIFLGTVDCHSPFSSTTFFEILKQLFTEVDVAIGSICRAVKCCIFTVYVLTWWTFGNRRWLGTLKERKKECTHFPTFISLGDLSGIVASEHWTWITTPAFHFTSFILP